MHASEDDSGRVIRENASALRTPNASASRARDGASSRLTPSRRRALGFRRRLREVDETIDAVRVVRLGPFVELKRAARRYRDFGDVVELIRTRGLDESFAERLHATVRRDYLTCLDEKRREEDIRSPRRLMEV